MAAARLVLPLKLFFTLYLAVLHAVCVCQAAGPARVETAGPVTADHACCHDEGGSSPDSAPDAGHPHLPGCQHCDGTSLLPASDASVHVVPVVAPCTQAFSAFVSWAFVAAVTPERVFPPPASRSDHPPLPILRQTTILVL